MLSFSALVAGSFAIGSLAAPHIAPTALNAVRFVLAGLILSGVAAASGKVTRASLEAPWRYLVLGGLMIGYFVLMFEGLKTAAPVSMSAVFTLTPVMAAGFGWLLMRQRMTRRMALALAVGAVGALWVIFDGSLQEALRFGVGRGEAVYFVGCAAHAIYAPMVRKLNRGEPALVFTLWTNLAGMVLLLIWGWPALIATDWAALPPIVWITIAYTAVAATAATFVLLQFAALRLPSAKVMAYTYLTPSWVILWTLALGQGVPPAMILVGVGLTVVALLLLLKDE
ncbi:DMT family transporter [Salipiger bermudensis]|uniref:DMT family transporter n=1 Tax=Salipiger bermudensis TaxID=344736 RepID=UPI001CD3AB72|nr:DMT family transporter [Salipiger bermudensis]MCA0963817.1 DMT family transporter [Salipiger bermudensis]